MSNVLGFALFLLPLILYSLYVVKEWKKSEVQREFYRERLQPLTMTEVVYPAYLRLSSSALIPYEHLTRECAVELYLDEYKKTLVQQIRHAIPIEFKFDVDMHNMRGPLVNCRAKIPVDNVLSMGDGQVTFYHLS